MHLWRFIQIQILFTSTTVFPRNSTPHETLNPRVTSSLSCSNKLNPRTFENYRARENNREPDQKKKEQPPARSASPRNSGARAAEKSPRGSSSPASSSSSSIAREIIAVAAIGTGEKMSPTSARAPARGPQKIGQLAKNAGACVHETAAAAAAASCFPRFFPTLRECCCCCSASSPIG